MEIVGCHEQAVLVMYDGRLKYFSPHSRFYWWNRNSEVLIKFPHKPQMQNFSIEVLTPLQKTKTARLKLELVFQWYYPQKHNLFNLMWILPYGGVENVVYGGTYFSNSVAVHELLEPSIIAAVRRAVIQNTWEKCFMDPESIESTILNLVCGSGSNFELLRLQSPKITIVNIDLPKELENILSSLPIIQLKREEKIKDAFSAADVKQISAIGDVKSFLPFLQTFSPDQLDIYLLFKVVEKDMAGFHYYPLPYSYYNIIMSCLPEVIQALKQSRGDFSSLETKLPPTLSTQLDQIIKKYSS